MLLGSSCSETGLDEQPDKKTETGNDPVRMYVSDETTEAQTQADPQSRAAFTDGYRIAWETGDQVAINWHDTYSMQQDETGRWYVELPEAESYTVYYPAYYRRGDIEGYPSFILNSEQHYSSGTFDKAAFCARAEAARGEKLVFDYLCSVVKLTLRGTASEQVATIKLEGNASEKFSYGGVVDKDADGKYSLHSIEDYFSGYAGMAHTFVNMNCDNVALTSDGVDFYLVLFPTTFSRGFKITVTLADGRTMVKSGTVAQTARRGRILAMPAITFVESGTETPVFYSTDNATWKAWKYADNGTTPMTLAYPATADHRLFFKDNASATGTRGLTAAHLAKLKTSFIDGKTDPIGFDFSQASYESTTFPAGVFSGGAGLTYVSLPRNIVSIADGTATTGAFAACTNLAEVAYPAGLTQIGDYAFAYSGLTEVVVPQRVTRVGTYAFEEATATAIRIEGAAGELNVGDYAFRCRNAAEVRCYRTTPPIGTKEIFSYLGYNLRLTTGTTLYVPTASLDAYLAATGWGWLADINKPSSTEKRFVFVGM